VKWQRPRWEFLGASDTPCLFGEGFKSVEDLWREKVERHEERPATGRLLRGLALEPTLSTMYTEATGVELSEPEWLLDKRTGFLAATPDRNRMEDGAPVELKTIDYYGDEYGENGSDAVPLRFLIQVTQQCALSKALFADVACLGVCEWDFRVFRVMFNPTLWELIVEAAKEFWACVKAGQPLPSGFAERWGGEVGATIPAAGKGIDLGDDFEEIVAKRQQLSLIRKEAEEAYEAATKEIKARMGDAQVGIAGRFQVKQSWVSPSTFTVERKGFSGIRITEIKAKGRRK